MTETTDNVTNKNEIIMMKTPLEIECTQDRMKISDALTLTGFGKFHLFLLFATGGCIMCVIIETMQMMFVIPAAECDLELTISMKGYISAASFLGIALTAHLWGFLADLHGRRIIILISMGLTFVVSVTSALAINSWMFLSLRFLTGLLLSGASSVIFTYIGELINDRHRPIILSWVVMFVAFGNMLMSALAWLILPLKFSPIVPVLNILFKSWRLLGIVNALPTLLFAFGIYLLPETPKYLLSKDREEDARLVLKKVYILNKGVSCNDFNFQKLILNEDFKQQTEPTGFLNLMFLQTLQLYQKPYLIKTLLIDTLQFGVFMVSIGFYMWYPEIMNKMSMFETENPDKKSTICGAIEYYTKNNYVSTNSTLSTCSDTIKPNVFAVNLFLGLYLAFLYFLIGCIVGYLGKKKCLISLLVISAVTALPVQYLSGSVVVKLFMGLTLASYTSIGLINSITVDMYPTQLRGIAVAMALMFGRIGAVVGAHMSGKLFYEMCNVSYVTYAISHIVFIVILHLLTSLIKVSKHKNIV